MMIKEAHGCTIIDTEGRRYLDFLGCAGTLALGHNHLVQTAAMVAHLQAKIPMQILDFCTVAKDDYVNELFNILPETMKNYRVQFCGGSGSDGIDAAVKLCKVATGRSSVLCFAGAFHGMGQGPLAMMGNLDSKSNFGASLMPGVQFIPYPNSYRQPLGLDATPGGAGDKACMAYLEHLLDDVESGITKPACIILEAIQGEGGCNAISDWAFQELRRITQERGIPLIADEIQCGICRSGRMFAFEYSGITPDVLVMSKAAGGSQPLACMVYKPELDKWSSGTHTGTFRGNGLAFSAGAASFRWMRENRLWDQAAAKGKLVVELLKAGNSPYIGDIRGKGLMIGVELIDPEGKKDPDGLYPPFGMLAQWTQAEAFRRGMLIERGGRGGAVMRPLPPLIITEDEIREACAILLASIAKSAEKIKAFKSKKPFARL